MKFTRLFFGIGLALMLATQTLHAQQSAADGNKLADLRTKAEKGDAKAQCELGRVFFNGELEVEKDPVEGVKWFRKAAEQNYAEAHGYLGASYLFGRGVPKDEAEAVKWFRKAAEQNDARGQLLLGNSYLFGRGVPKDEVEAVKWFRKAAEQNYAKAQSLLGICYHTGQGVPMDKVEACKWFLLATAQGDVFAKKQLAILKDEISPFPNAEVLRRVNEWAKQHRKTSAEKGSRP